MAGLLDTYNAQVMAVECPKCGVGKYERCRGRLGAVITPAHATRLTVAGYRWDKVTKRLEKLAWSRR